MRVRLRSKVKITRGKIYASSGDAIATHSSHNFSIHEYPVT